jgi:hypothetical protein
LVLPLMMAMMYGTKARTKSRPAKVENSERIVCTPC